MHLFRDYCEHRGLVHPEIERYLDYLWEFIGFYGDGEAFGRWLDREAPLIHAGLGYDYPPGFEELFAAGWAPEPEFRRALVATTEVLYSSLYSVANEEWSRHFLTELARVVVPLGVHWPDLRPMVGSRWFDDSGWGNRPSAQELADWRARRRER